MRCPKCHYLSFEPEPRCKNCGYDLALSDPSPVQGSEPADQPTPEALKAYTSEAALDEPPVSRPKRRSSVRAAGSRAAARAAALHLDPTEEFESEREEAPAHETPPEAVPDVVARQPEPEPAPEADAPVEAPAARSIDTIDAPRPGPMRIVTPVPSAPARAAQPSRPAVSSRPDATEGTDAPSRPAAPPGFDPANTPLRRPDDLPAAAARATVDQPLAPPARRPSIPPTSDLPLFVRGTPAPQPDADLDAPLVSVPDTPRAPLSVQRRAPDTGRVSKPARPAGQFDRDLIEDLQLLERLERRHAAERARALGQPVPTGEIAGWPRFESTLIDVSLLGVVGAAVTWLSAQTAGVALEDVLTRLPLLPIAAFLLLVTLGYLMLFTVAGGQTIGKMLAGTRVVASDDEADGGSLTMQQVAVRSAASVPSVLLACAGLLPALLGRGPALHDRAAGTRVVRA
ncbi:MAG: RDD family protein [Vicinamibacterales bacterium]